MPRPCLYYDIKLCTGPCIGAINQAGYRQMIDDLCQFLEGNTDADRISACARRWKQAAEELRFERAAAIRDQIQAIEQVVENQKVISPEQIDSDVIAMARADGEACVQIFFIRSGKLIGREYFILEGTEDDDRQRGDRRVHQAVLLRSAQVPPQVLLPKEVEEAKIIKQWLQHAPRRAERWS